MPKVSDAQNGKYGKKICQPRPSVGQLKEQIVRKKNGGVQTSVKKVPPHDYYTHAVHQQLPSAPQKSPQSSAKKNKRII